MLDTSPNWNATPFSRKYPPRNTLFRKGLLLLICSSPLWMHLSLTAGAWTPKKGGAYFKLAGNLFKSNANFDASGNSIEPFAGIDDQFSRFRDENLSFYYEVGLTDRLALFGGLVYKDLNQRTKTADIDVSAANSGLGDFDLGLRYRLTEGPNIWSVSLLAKLPYLYENDDDFFRLGNKQEDFEARLLYGRGLGRGLYTGLEAGYRLRLQDPSDEYRFLGEFGYGGRRFYTRGKLEIIRSADDIPRENLFGNPLLSNSYDLGKWEATVGYQITPRWHVEFTYLEVFEGRNTADGFNRQWALIYTF